MRSLLLWIIAGVLGPGLISLGVPFLVGMALSIPFALLAGWSFAGSLTTTTHECGWCGRRFTGPYEWVCPDCEGEASR